MVDPAIIREKYASMTDDQLLHLATQDINGITEEALLLLKEEFAKRHLDLGVFTAAETQDDEDADREPIPGFYNPATATDDALLGRNYISIRDPAHEAALAALANKLPADLTTEEALKVINKCEWSMIIYGLIAIGGLVLTLTTFFLAARSGGSFVVAWGLIMFGGINFFTSLAKRSRYKAFLNGMDVQNDHLHNT